MQLLNQLTLAFDQFIDKPTVIKLK